MKAIIIIFLFLISNGFSQTYKIVDGNMFSAKVPITFIFDKINSSPDYCAYESYSSGIKVIRFNSLNKYRFELQSIQDMFSLAIERSDIKISYKIQKSNWFIISGTSSNGNIVYWKRIVGENFISDMHIEYNSSQKDIIEPYILEISRSFASL